MKKIFKTLPYIVLSLLVGFTAVYATSKLTPPGAVSNTMYSLSDIYNLASGTTATEGTGTIQTTPSLSETGKTLTEVYTAISTEIAKLSSSVIANGTTAFGIIGDTDVVDTSSGDATVNDIITGKKAWVDGMEIEGVASAGTNYGIPKTGQTTCLQVEIGIPVSCVGTGQDGEYQTGQTRSYTDNSDGTITDNTTGLMWKKCSQGQSGADCSGDSATGFSLKNAITSCETDSTIYTDWRLPNIFELFSLVDFGKTSSPLINASTFPNTIGSYYWVSTTNLIEGNADYSWSVRFLTGGVEMSSRNGNQYVRCVRNL